MLFFRFSDTIVAKRRCTASIRNTAAGAVIRSSSIMSVYTIFFSVFMASVLFCL